MTYKINFVGVDYIKQVRSDIYTKLVLAGFILIVFYIDSSIRYSSDLMKYILFFGIFLPFVLGSILIGLRKKYLFLRRIILEVNVKTDSIFISNDAIKPRNNSINSFDNSKLTICTDFKNLGLVYLVEINEIKYLLVKDFISEGFDDVLEYLDSINRKNP